MQATNATRRARPNLARLIIIVGLALALALATLLARAALSMAIDPQLGGIGFAAGSSNPYVAEVIPSPSPSAAPDPISDPTAAPPPAAIPAPTAAPAPVDQHKVIRSRSRLSA
jgi:hypothetical protein